jgi:hypothetical protein
MAVRLLLLTMTAVVTLLLPLLPLYPPAGAVTV